VGLSLGAGVALGFLWAFGCLFLLGLDAPRWPLFDGGVAAGAIAAALLPKGPLGARGAARILGGLTLGGALIAGLASASLARTLGAAPAVALALACLGAAITVGLVAAILAWQLVHATTVDRETPDAGLPLRSLVAVTCGALALAAWALASGHVLGQRHADSARTALAEARSLVAITVERSLIHREDPAHALTVFDALAAQLAPQGGYLVEVDEQGLVRAGAGAALDETLAVDDAAVSCRVAHRLLPCAARRLADGSRVVAAVPRAPVGSDVVIAFALVGLVIVGGAIGIGGLVGAATARDLDRVSGTLDELRRGAKGQQIDLERPIVVAALDEAGELAGALGRLRARLAPRLAEYRQALERAMAADRARDEFLALVSIELRSPLDEILAAARTLLDDQREKLTPEQRDDVTTVVSASQHLLELIEEVLDVSAIASGQVTLRLGDVDICKILSEAAKAQRPIVQGKGVEVRLDLPTPAPHIRGDERRLRQVITNIISNAVKFTEKGGIDIAARRRGFEVEITVKDTGPGIAAEQLPKLFREFVQLGSLRQRAHGTGLGLAICKRLVNAHRGEVSAESEIGVGSTFKVVLPVSGPPVEPVGDDTPVQAT
jgi:signal transduction histidine kinase